MCGILSVVKALTPELNSILIGDPVTVATLRVRSPFACNLSSGILWKGGESWFAQRRRQQTKTINRPETENIMKILRQLRIITLALACAALAMTAATAHAAPIKGNSGNNFELSPTPMPGVLTLTHPGVAQVSLLGNCTFDGDEVVLVPTAPGQPFILKGTWRFVSADGATTLDAEVEGTGTPDPANPNFVNLHYDVKFTGGTGQMANARGRAEMDGVAMFTSPSGGTTTFVFAGKISTDKHNDHE